MSEIKITFCNKAYAKRWFKNLQCHNPIHYFTIQAIINEIKDKDGGDICKSDIFERDPGILERISKLSFNIIPSRGQLLKHNGNGIRHVKFSPSKSVAIIWEKIGQTIFVTFDDHAPLPYHRSIAHLRDIKLGRPVFPKRPRLTGRFLRKYQLYRTDRYSLQMRGFDPKRRHYE